MKTPPRLFALFTVFTLLAAPAAFAQGTQFTYQGVVRFNGAPVNGVFDLSFAAFDLAGGGTLQGVSNLVSGLSLTNGQLTTQLDFGAGVFTGANRFLQIAIRTNGGGAFTNLSPRQKLTASPYAVFAGGANAAGLTGTLPSASLAGTYSGALALNNAGNSFTGNGAGLTSLNASNLTGGTVADARLSANVALLNRNGQTFTGANAFSGPVQVAPNSTLYALRIDQGINGDGILSYVNTTSSTRTLFHATGNGPGLIVKGDGSVGIGANNPVTALQVNGTITADAISGEGSQPLDFFAGGTRALRLESGSGTPNVIGGSAGNFILPGVVGSTIAGGGATNYMGFPATNTIRADLAFIGGGAFHTVASTFGTIGGGSSGMIATNSPFATIAGGSANFIGPDSLQSTIGGGSANTITSNSWIGVIAGGNNSRIGANARAATISGGQRNTNLASHATIAGGEYNAITTSGDHAAIGGGSDNSAGGAFTTISGGAFNAALGLDGNVIGGGIGNYITKYGRSVISGGEGHFIEANGGTIGGGLSNAITIPAAAFAAIGGGFMNVVQGAYGVIPGGYSNWVAGNFSLAAGHRANALDDGSFVWADSQEADFISTGINQFLIRASGGVGIGTADPAAPLHVSGSGTNAIAVIENTSDNPVSLAFQTGFRTWRIGQNRPPGSSATDAFFIYDDNAQRTRMLITTGGRVGIGTNSPLSELHVVGTVTATAFNPPSDRNLKENFAPVSPREVLDKVAGLAISRWNFIGDTATPHVGPMAQDFHAAFGLGTDDKHIATVDADGVALAAIQGLNQKLEQNLEQKETEITELRQRLDVLEKLLNRLTVAKETGGR